jgi:excisionase family DNA binding protein
MREKATNVAAKCGYGDAEETMAEALEPDQETRMGDVDAGDAELLLDVKTAAKLLAISSATLRRLSDSGLAPRPMKLGRAVRYRRAELEQWVAAGCPRVAPLYGRRRRVR